jgi:diaminopimelate decarboxylase
MNDLMLPALCNSIYKIQNLTGKENDEGYHITGRFCVSSDILVKEIILPQLRWGVLIAIRTI